MNKIFMSISVVLNGILLMFLFGPLQFFLYLSLILLTGSALYIKHLLENRKQMAQEMEKLIDKMSLFSSYLEGIYELEVFYGDETIQEMIEQSKYLMNDFYDFEESFLDRDYYEEDNDDTNEEDRKEEEI